MNRIWCTSKKYVLHNVQSNVFCNFVTYFSFKAEIVNSRSLIKIRGADVYSFLQGLITNDVYHLNEHKYSLYTLFLNNKGRVLCDSILYKYEDDNTLLIECDSKIEKDLICRLKYYRVRKQIDIESATEKLWVIFNKNAHIFPTISDKDIKSIETMTLCRSPELQNNLNDEYDYLKRVLSDLPVTVYKDPRMHLLGFRVITKQNVNVCLEKLKFDLNVDDDYNYTTLRYELGVGEGITELPTEKCFPLEINCDYLHGVSFHKGCYIGQELTARTHHTGVVRKRLMPLIFHAVPDLSLPFDSPVEIRGHNKNVGKLRGCNGKYGIGLLRIGEVLENSDNLLINNINTSTYRPVWWPQQTQNDNIRTSKE